ncbi:MAG: BamA/TamA family outer membrane protein, partial [Calditrichaceae bacterium]
QPGNKLNYIQLNNDLDKIIMYYRKNGYSLADITKLTWNEYTDSLSITIDEGVINDIEVIGNELTQHFVIEREFKYQKGHVFNWMPVQRAIQNVYATNLFERVNVEFAKMDSSYKMMIKVQEKSPIVARLGGKYDSDRRMQAYLELSHENIWGTGMQVDFLSRLGMRDGNIGLSIIEDRIFLSNFNFGIKTYHTWEINPVAMPGEPSGRYREERTGLRIQLGRQVRRLGQLVAELRQEFVSDYTYSGQFDPEQEIEIRTISLHASTDKRDRRDFPTTGIYNKWIWESGNRLVLDADETFTKAMINLEGYYTLHSRSTWHLKLFAGYGDQTLPFSENFRLGGLHSFYGLAENAYYGRQLFLASAEYRYRLPVNLGKNNLLVNDMYVLARYDFAGIWDKPELLFSIDDFFSGIGGSLAFDTFLGPFYLGYGRTTRGEDHAYVSIGLNF